MNSNQDQNNEPEPSPSASSSCDLKPILALMEEGISPRLILNQISPGLIIPPDADDLSLWRSIMNILEPPRRKKIQEFNTLDDAVKLINQSKNIIVLSGAGISTSAGIPDFRSRDGIYVQIHEQYPDLRDPKMMFDINYFRRNPLPFYRFAKALFPGQFMPTIGHKFIKCIEDNHKLLRNYTQNIDTLEKQTGIQRVIECHGSFAMASCTNCGHTVDGNSIKDDVLTQTVPRCTNCEVDPHMPLGLGVMKPNIVFFGENLGDEFHKSFDQDRDKVDLLIVIGSSLKVRPVALIPRSIPANVPQLLINREPLDHVNFDIELLGNCDEIIQELCLRLGEQWTSVCQVDAKPSNEIVGIPKSVLDSTTSQKNNSTIELEQKPDDSTKHPEDAEKQGELTNHGGPLTIHSSTQQPETKSETEQPEQTDSATGDYNHADDDGDDDDWEDVEIIGENDSCSSSECHDEIEYQPRFDLDIPKQSFLYVKPNVYLFNGVELNRGQLREFCSKATTCEPIEVKHQQKNE